MSNQLEIVSQFQGCTKWNQKENPFLEGDIKGFIDIKHTGGTDQMLVVNAYFPENDYQGELVFLPITEELDISLKMQDAEIDDYIVIDSEVKVPIKYGEFCNLVLIDKERSFDSVVLDYAKKRSCRL